MSHAETVKIKDGTDFRIINESDFNPNVHKLCDGETLDEGHQITVTLNAEIAPELQQVIDEAKAKCEKVIAENADLKQQIETLKADIASGGPVDLSGLVPVEQFDVVAEKLVDAEEKLKQSHGELVASQDENTVLKAKISELEAKPKLKAAKTTEETKPVEQPKE